MSIRAHRIAGVLTVPFFDEDIRGFETSKAMESHPIGTVNTGDYNPDFELDYEKRKRR
jgi:hypothetical protein